MSQRSSGRGGVRRGDRSPTSKRWQAGRGDGYPFGLQRRHHLRPAHRPGVGRRPRRTNRPAAGGDGAGRHQRLPNVQTTVEVAISEVQRATGSYDLDYEGIARRVADTALERLEDPPVRARITTVGGTEEEEFDIFDQVVPGYAVMFAMFTVLSAAGGILDEKERGTFKRLLIAPIPQWSLLGGKLLAQFLMGVGQIALMFLEVDLSRARARALRKILGW